MKKRILFAISLLVILITALAFPAGAVMGMSVMGGFSYDNLHSGKASAFSDAKSISSGAKFQALSSYSFMPKPDLNFYVKDTTLYADPAQLAAWNTRATSIPESQSDYFGLFLPKSWGSCGG